MKLVKENVLVNAAGHACLSDIGFATFAHNGESEPDDTESGTHSSRWTAPEVSKNSEFSKQSDVFSFGFVAVEVCSQNRLPLYTPLTMPRYSQESCYGERLA